MNLHEYVIEKAADILDLPTDTIEDLALGNLHSTPIFLNVTPYKAAAVVRNLISTGTVDWDSYEK